MQQHHLQYDDTFFKYMFIGAWRFSHHMTAPAGRTMSWLTTKTWTSLLVVWDQPLRRVGNLSAPSSSSHEHPWSRGAYAASDFGTAFQNNPWAMASYAAKGVVGGLG